MKLIQMGVLAAGVAAALALAGVGTTGGARGDTGADAGALTVSGSGAVTGVPDQAELSFGVTTQGGSAAQALGANAAEMRRVIAALVDARIEQKDIQTESVELSPVYSENGDTVVGYRASNSVSATVRDLVRAGAVVDAAVGAGANQVSGPSLTRSDEDTLYQSALKAAVANGRAKAAVLAAAAGVQLGAARTVTETGELPSPKPFEARQAIGADSTPIEPGTQTITASVTIEFAIS
jgi:uncharacterized protein YggE